MNFFQFLKKEKQFLWALVVLILVLFGMFYMYFLAAPRNFEKDNLVIITKGSTLRDISKQLTIEKVISSPIVFSRIVAILGGERSVQAGSYYFQNPQNVFVVAKRIVDGELGLDPVKVTVPEGFTRVQITKLFDESFERFDPEKFLEITKDKEGYLFPDTYFFFPDITAEDVMITMEDNFKAKTLELNRKFTESGHNLQEIITMASIVEAEAYNLRDMQMIAGVLWNRIEIDMPLQVDVTFRYINGKGTFDLTYDDLKIDSSYNTYVYTGLPPTPISNPGLNAIIATVDYVESDYLFFLADKYGQIHYAKTLAGHKQNKSLYLQ